MVRWQITLFSLFPLQYYLPLIWATGTHTVGPRIANDFHVVVCVSTLRPVSLLPAYISPLLTRRYGGIPLWVNPIPTFPLCCALFILSVSSALFACLSPHLHTCLSIFNAYLSLPLFVPPSLSRVNKCILHSSLVSHKTLLQLCLKHRHTQIPE